MSKFVVNEYRVETTDPDKSLLLGYDVLETDDEGNLVQKVNTSTLGQQGARELAATLTWMAHLDAWMTTVVEDADVTDEVAEILGLDRDLPIDSEDSDEIERAYDKMMVGALKFLPYGLRRLADRYEKEWSENAELV